MTSAESTLRKLVRGGALTTFGQLGSAAVSLASIVVLSRLLPPSDFGLVAMVGVVTALGNLIRDMGFTVAALRSPKLTSQQASNLFWINVALSIIVAAAIALSGSLLAELYSEPRLESITPVLAVSMLLGGSQAQFQVKLARDQSYGILAAIAFGASLAGFLVALVMALLGLGYWSLVGQVLAIAVVEFLAKITCARWRPSRPRLGSGTKALAQSGADVAAANLASYAASNVSTFMIGVRMGAADVGLYNRALQLTSLPSTLLGPLVNVAVPVLQEGKQRGENTSAQLLKLQTFLATWSALVLATAAASAPYVFLHVLGANWSDAAPLFRMLAIVGVVEALAQVNYWGFLLESGTRTLLRYNLVSKPLTTILVLIGSLISLPAVAFAYSGARVMSWLIGVWWLGRSSRIDGKKLAFSGVRIMVAGSIGGAAGSLVPAFLPDGAMGEMLMPILVAALVFFGVSAITRGGRNDIAEFRMNIVALRRRIHHRENNKTPEGPHPS